MRESIVRTAVVVLLLTLAGVTDAVATCYKIGEVTRDEVTESYNGSDCWFDATPNAMVTYLWVARLHNINRYEIYQCDYGYQYEQFVGTVYSYTQNCWRPTSTQCVGWQDWEPSPQC